MWRSTNIKFFFTYCSSVSVGVGISIAQNTKIGFFELTFDHCKATKKGGAAHVSTTNKSEDISNTKMLPNFTIEYACINKCSTSGDCSCFCEGAVRLTSLYVSSNIEMTTTDTTITSNIAHFGYVTNNLVQKYLNLTGGNSLYSGSFEYYQITNLNFQYVNFYKIRATYMSAFCLPGAPQNSVCSNCNYIECIWAGYSRNKCGFIYFTAPLEVDNLNNLFLEKLV